VVISLNPKAGRRPVDREVNRFVELLRGSPLEATVLTDLGEVAAKANGWHAEGRLRVLVGVGGDGTAAELVNRTQPGVPITLLAAGTANILSKHFGLPTRAEELLSTVASGPAVQLDAGVASGRIFLLMVGCGFDAEVVQRVHQRRAIAGGGHISYGSYLKPILESIRSYQYPELRVYCDEQCLGAAGGEAPCVAARWAFVCNLPRYGWGVRLAPEADGTDGLLDLCTFQRGSLWHGLRFLAAVQLGVHRGLAGCAMRRVRRLRIEADEPVPYQLDGDPGGRLPVEIEVLTRRVTLLVPPRPEPS
jgi:diacylglycerol kinase (ATP)